jgi:hypothetical protein
VAGGIDWFRWHHGSVTDPKFGLVAKKAGARIGDVIALWAFLLEAASSDADRGTIGQLDFESIEHLLGLGDGDAVRILEAMTARGLIVGSRIASWEKRQPKREREGDLSTDRVKALRERQRHETPRNAMERQETPRGEESREEEEELFGQFWSSYPRKVGKDAARKAFAKRSPDAPLLALMVSAIKRQGLAAKCAKGESQYVPHPSTWLNEGRWQDEEGSPVDDDPYGLKKAINYER